MYDVDTPQLVTDRIAAMLADSKKLDADLNTFRRSAMKMPGWFQEQTIELQVPGSNLRFLFFSLLHQSFGLMTM